MQPIPVCLVAYILGMLVGSFLDPQVSQIYFWILLILSFSVCFFLRTRRSVLFLLLFSSFFLIGLLRIPLHLNPPAELSHISHYCGPDPVIVEGSVLRVNLRDADQSSLDIAVSRLSSHGIALPVTGRVRLYLGSGTPQLLSGDRVTFRSRLRRPRVFGTPGEFNMPRYLAYSDLWVTAFLPDSGALVRLSGKRQGLLRQIDNWRQQSRREIEQNVSVELAPLVRSLALGERGILSEAQRRQLARSGIAHLFAISGLHLGLLALFGYRILLFVYRRSSRLLLWQPPQRVLPLVLLPLLFGYLILTGDALSTRRAFAACCCASVLLLCKRRVAPLQLLAGLALLFLLLEPLALWQVSFQLSFAGVAGILCWQRYWLLGGFRQHWLLKRLLQIFLVSLAATLATAPIVIMVFHLFSPAGLFNNLFAIPLVALVAVPAGLVGVFLAFIWPWLAGVAFWLCSKVLHLTILLAGWVVEVPGLGGQTFFLSRGQLTIIAGAAILILVPWRRVVWPTALLAILLLPLLVAGPTDTQGISLTVFSVGQGESMLLTLDGHTNILVDGGGLYSDSFDVGERLLVPALACLGVQRLDAVLLTHDHPDHSKGLQYLLDELPVAAFWCGVAPETLSAELQQRLAREQVSVEYFPPGWSRVALPTGRELSLFVPALVTSSKNDRSVALYANQGNDGLLLTGDLEQAGAKILLAAGVPGPVSLLKLPHHGSRHSGSSQLLQALLPEKVVTSVGYRNHYRFPAQEVVNEVLQTGAEFYRTDWMGTIRFTSRGRGWQVEQWRNGLFR